MDYTTYGSCVASSADYSTTQPAQANLAALNGALERARESAGDCHLLTHQRRNELMQHSATFKGSINAVEHEHAYDLATLLELLTLTAFGSQQDDGGALELMERSIAILRRTLAGDSTAGNECAKLTEEVWTWLGNSNGLPTKL